LSFVPNAWRPRPDELTGKTILITGAGDGIGKAAALAYAAHGAEVLLLGKTEAKLEQVYDQILAAGGKEPGIIPSDLSQVSHDALCALAGELASSVNKLDGLLHNASILGDRKPMEQTSANTWHQVMQVNVNAAFMLTQTMIPLLEKADHASVVFTSSGVGRKGRAFWGAYAVSKFATEGVMQTLADEYQNKSIRFNCINPGATRTSMRAQAFPAETPETLKTPEDIMPTYLYLMGNDSADVNGESLDCQPK